MMQWVKILMTVMMKVTILYVFFVGIYSICRVIDYKEYLLLRIAMVLKKYCACAAFILD